MRQDRWTDDEENKHSRWTLVANDTEWLNKPRGATNGDNGNQPISEGEEAF